MVSMKVTLALFVVSFQLSSAFVPSSRRFLLRQSDVSIFSSINEESQAVAGSIGARLPDMEAYTKGYKTVFEEQSCHECTQMLGSVPPDLKGTYYRSVPAMFSAGSIVPPKKSIVQPKQPPVPDGQDMARMQQHPFEADGGILAVTFGSDNRVTSRFKFVRTIAFTAERKKGARTYKGMDSTREMGASLAAGLGNDLPLPLFRHHLQPGLNKNRRNTSNSRAIYWGKRLLAMWEGGQPYKMDSIALSTEGKSRLGGAIKREEDPFGGKMVYDSKTNTALFYGLQQGAKSSEIAFYEFNDKFRLVDEGRQFIDVPGYALFNDFAVTENYGVFITPSVEVDNFQFLVSKEPGKSLKVKSEPATLHLIPRAGKSVPRKTIEIPFDGTIDANHLFCNAYEENGKLIIDLIRSDGKNVRDTVPQWPWGRTLDEYQSISSKKSLWCYEVDLASNEVSKFMVSNDHVLFPAINPGVSAQKHQFIYANIGALGEVVAPPQGLVKYDVISGTRAVWLPQEFEFCGEPSFVPREGEMGEDDGYILSVLFNGRTEQSELLIFDARSIDMGPITRIPLNMSVPHGLFGCFASGQDSSWEYETILRRAKLADKMEAQGNKWNEVKSDFSGLGLRLDDMEEYFGDFFS